jgi:ferredoxin
MTIETRGAVGRKLLAVAREHGIPILFGCSAAACGACLVEIVCSAGAKPAMTPAGEDEALILCAMNKRAATEGDGATAIHVAPRLACQFIVPEADILVRYPRALGGG